MRRIVRFSNLLAVTLAATASLALAQDFIQKPKAPAPDEMPGTQLIVWTETQRPHPVPEISPEMYVANEPAQLLTGTILTRGSELFFADAHHPAFRIENQKEQIRPLSGKRVRIYGNVDGNTNVVYVLSIVQL